MIMSRKHYSICLLFCLMLAHLLPAQEALKSAEEEYYDFLSLQGLTTRPTLNYRTLSDSTWTVDEDVSHPWQNQNLGIFYPVFGDSHMRGYGPELFMSGNTAAPYGNNDGVLWQGRGLNASFKTGVRFEGYGVELTLLPHLAFSQNAPFDIMAPYYESNYSYFWGYDMAGISGADAPQRFGNKPFFDWDFGDSELRYTWKTLTIGFGTQAIWLGPAHNNPILHSNNAPAYPKFDIGLRRQSVTIPGLDWYAGDVEARFWVGRLSESDYFDSDNSNNYTILHGLAMAYAPSFLPGLTLSANRTCLVPWSWGNLKYIVPMYENTIEDQKVSFGLSWMFPQVGLEIYGEMGLDDNWLKFHSLLTERFHTTVFTGGLRKTLNIKPEKSTYGMIAFEYNWMEATQDFQFQWPYTFYFHHLITHGYTNRGQWLGNGVSPGGHSMDLSFTLYYPKGNSSFFIGRNNPDNNYLYSKAIYDSATGGDLAKNYWGHNWGNILIGLETGYFLNTHLFISGGIINNIIVNKHYKRNAKNEKDRYDYNFSAQLLLKFLM